jgi:hypothetical protein
MKKIKNHRLEKLAERVVEIRKEKSKLEKQEKRVAQTLIKWMEKKGKTVVVVEKEHKVVRLMKPIILKVDPLKVFRLLSIKKFLEVVAVKVEDAVRMLGREKVEEIAEKKEGAPYLRIENVKK